MMLQTLCIIQFNPHNHHSDIGIVDEKIKF